MTTEEKLKARLTELEKQIEDQKEIIANIDKRTKKHKWLILSLLFDK